jgi:hypothetical protein
MSSLASVGAQGNAHILRQFRPVDAEDDSWMSDATKVQTAYDEAGARLKRGLPDNHFSSEKQRERINKKWKDQGLQVFHKSLEGKELNMRLDGRGRCLLYWTKPDGSQCTVELYVPTFARPTLSDQDRSRFVHFTADGIEIRNASGAVVRKAGVVAGPTVSRGEMQLMSNSENLLALWTVQTGYVAPAASTGPTVDIYGAKGQPLIRSATKTTTLEGYPKPPNAIAGMLSGFSTSSSIQVPNGGTLVSCVRTDLRPNDNFWIFFRTYLSANHPNHPYHGLWTAWAQPGVATRNARDIGPNIEFCRDCSKVTQQINIRRGEATTATTFTVVPRRTGW